MSVGVSSSGANIAQPSRGYGPGSSPAWRFEYYATYYYNNLIWVLGYWGDNADDVNAARDTDVRTTMLRHGNYDYVNESVEWDESISERAMPNSLDYTEKPTWFGDCPWPPIGPDVAGYVSDIPAKARWDAYLVSGDLDDLF